MSTLYTIIGTALLASALDAQTAELAGRWKVALHDADGVQLDFRMTFAVTGDQEPLRWEAYSRQGAARELVGGATATLGRLFGRMPPREALIYIGEGVAERRGDRLHLTGALESPFLGRRNLTGSLVAGRLQAELTRVSTGVKAGTLEAARDTSDGPLTTLNRPQEAERQDFLSRRVLFCS